MRLSLLFLIVLNSSTAFAADYFSCAKPVSNGLAKLKLVADNFSKISSFQGKFEQHSVLLGFNQSANSKGNLVFKRQGRMDWEYFEPEEQRFVTDGKTVWFYQKSLNQVTVSPFKESFSSDLPVSFLMGLSDLDNSFKLKRACSSTFGWLFELEPKSADPTLSRFLLLMDKNEKTPKAVKITDVGGNDTEIVLDQLETEVELPDERFSYQIPKGVDVIDRRTPQ